MDPEKLFTLIQDAVKEEGLRLSLELEKVKCTAEKHRLRKVLSQLIALLWDVLQEVPSPRGLENSSPFTGDVLYETKKNAAYSVSLSGCALWSSVLWFTVKITLQMYLAYRCLRYIFCVVGWHQELRRNLVVVGELTHSTSDYSTSSATETSLPQHAAPNRLSWRNSDQEIVTISSRWYTPTSSSVRLRFCVGWGLLLVGCCLLCVLLTVVPQCRVVMHWLFQLVLPSSWWETVSGVNAFETSPISVFSLDSLQRHLLDSLLMRYLFQVSVFVVLKKFAVVLLPVITGIALGSLWQADAVMESVEKYAVINLERHVEADEERNVEGAVRISTNPEESQLVK